MNYPMYNNNQFYMQDLQNMRDKIDRQMQQIQQTQNQYQMQQPIPQVTQNFQLAPQNNGNELESKYADNIEQVKNTFVIKTGVFINKDFSTFWIKDVSGNIRTFKTEEVIEMDEKDKEIYMLKRELEEIKKKQISQPLTEGEFENATEHINSIPNGATTKEKSQKFSNNKYPNAK